MEEIVKIRYRDFLKQKASSLKPAARKVFLVESDPDNRGKGDKDRAKDLGMTETAYTRQKTSMYQQLGFRAEGHKREDFLHQLEKEFSESPSEQERKKILALDLATQASELMRNQQVHLLSRSVLLATESVRLHHCWQSDQVLRQGLSLLPRPLATLKHEGRVKAVNFSSNGKYLVTGGRDCTARIWNVSGQLFNNPFLHERAVSDAILSPDEKYLITISDEEYIDPLYGRTPASVVCVIEVATHQILDRKQFRDYVTTVAFSPDGKELITAGADGTVIFWEVIDGKLQPFAHGNHQNSVIDAAFSLDGSFIGLAIAGEDRVMLYPQADCRVVPYIEHKELEAIAFSSDGKLVATASLDGTAKVWNLINGQEIFCRTHEDIIWAVSFSPDGRYLATAGRSKTACVWEIASEQEVARMIHDSFVYDVAFSPVSNDRYVLATASGDKTVQLWELASIPEITFTEHRDICTIQSVSLSPNGIYLATLSEDGLIRVWDITRNQQVSQIPHKQAVKPVAFSSDGEYLATTSKGNTVWIWKWKDIGKNINYKPVMSMQHESVIQDVTFSPKGNYVATANKHGSVKLWNFLTESEIQELPPKTIYSIQLVEKDTLESVAFSQDERYLIVGSFQGIIQVFEVDSGEKIQQFIHEITK
jgi:WD40 repeat protein